MPLKKGKKNRKANFHELRHGQSFRRPARKFGQKRALKQMVALELSNARKTGKKRAAKKRQ